MREIASPLTSQTTPDIPVSDDKDTDNSGLSICYLNEWDTQSKIQLLLLINIGWVEVRFPGTLYRHHGQEQEESDDDDVQQVDRCNSMIEEERSYNDMNLSSF